MKQLATVTINGKMLNAKGKEVPTTEYALQIRGEDKEYSADEVTFKPLAYYTKILQWNEGPTKNKVVNETVYFTMDNFGDAMIEDRLGGNACGRSFKSWGKVANPNDAKWYGYIFGEVTFPGKAPVLVNYRITGGQCMAWGAVEKVIKDNLPAALLKLTAVGHEDKPHLSTVAYSILQQNLDTTGNEAALKEVATFIEEQNNKILDEYHAAQSKKTA